MHKICLRYIVYSPVNLVKCHTCQINVKIPSHLTRVQSRNRSEKHWSEFATCKTTPSMSPTSLQIRLMDRKVSCWRKCCRSCWPFSILLKVWTVDDEFWVKARFGSTRDLMNDDLTVQQEQRTGLNTFLLCNCHCLQSSLSLHNHSHLFYIYWD